MPQLGRTRDPKIKREERHCLIHGLTTFAFYTAGASKSQTASCSWHCMACNRDTDAEYRARVKSGEQVVVPRKLIPELTRPKCGGCFVEMGAAEGIETAAGILICDECRGE